MPISNDNKRARVENLEAAQSVDTTNTAAGYYSPQAISARMQDSISKFQASYLALSNNSALICVEQQQAKQQLSNIYSEVYSFVAGTNNLILGFKKEVDGLQSLNAALKGALEERDAELRIINIGLAMVDDIPTQAASSPRSSTSSAATQSFLKRRMSA
jgi:hypothetical protein